MGPQLWLILALAAATPATYGYMWIKQQILVTNAYDAGKKVGAEQVAAKTTATARETVSAVAAGEASADVVSPERAEIIKLCARSASCRDRGK